MITNKAFKRILNDKSITLTDEELENIIEDELLKPEEELDADLIEYCIDELERRKTAPKRKQGRLIKMLVPAAAAVLALALLAGLYGSGALGGNYEMRGTELSEELAENGFEGAYLPDEILSRRCKIEKIEYRELIPEPEAAESSFFAQIHLAEIDFENKGKDEKIIIEKYESKKSLLDDISSNASNLEEVNTNGRKVYVFRKNGRNSLYYRDGTKQYVITLPFSYEETAEFAKNIK